MLMCLSCLDLQGNVTRENKKASIMIEENVRMNILVFE